MQRNKSLVLIQNGMAAAELKPYCNLTASNDMSDVKLIQAICLRGGASYIFIKLPEGSFSWVMGDRQNFNKTVLESPSRR